MPGGGSVMQSRENRTLEYKERFTSTFLKTVSAFANYGGGTVIFGVADDGRPVGLDDPEQTCLDIENSVNDNLSPVPPCSFELDSSRKLVTLKVDEGPDKPYLYKGKAWRRIDTATVEVSRLELNRLILEGSNRNYEDLPALSADLTFRVLEDKLRQALGISALSRDVMKTLGLYTDAGGSNRAAELLADSNEFPGVDLVRFGASIDELRDREVHEHESVLLQYDHALALFRKYYQYEKIEGSERTLAELIPEKAFREALANALVHRAWDVPAAVRVAMYDDRVEITSPGGLPPGLSEDEYLHSQISVLRNPRLANVLFRLGLVEKFGTGIRRIQSAYAGLLVSPVFSAYAESVAVSLPVVNALPELDGDERHVYDALFRGRIFTRGEIERASGFGKAKLLRVLTRLEEKKVVERLGRGRGTRYRLR